jgi:hypothetical protein
LKRALVLIILVALASPCMAYSKPYIVSLIGLLDKDGNIDKSKAKLLESQIDLVHDDIYTKLTTLFNMNSSSQTITGAKTFTGPVTVQSLTFSDGSTQNFASKLLQIQAYTNTNDSGTTSINYVPTGYAVTITPKSATSKIKVTVSGEMKVTGNGDGGFATIFRNGVNVFGGNTYSMVMYAVTAFDYPAMMNTVYIDSPATTSPLTYSVYFRTDAPSAPLHWNDQQLQSSIVVEEIAP